MSKKHVASIKVGQIVGYVMPEDHGCEGQVRPAIVTSVSEEGDPNLHVLLDRALDQNLPLDPDQMATVKLDPDKGPGTYHLLDS